MSELAEVWAAKIFIPFGLQLKYSKYSGYGDFFAPQMVLCAITGLLVEKGASGRSELSSSRSFDCGSRTKPRTFAQDDGEVLFILYISIIAEWE